MKFASVFVLSTAIVAMGIAPAAFAASPPPSAPLPSLDEAAKTLTGEQPAKPTACEFYKADP